jgi:hypothetical protein
MWCVCVCVCFHEKERKLRRLYPDMNWINFEFLHTLPLFGEYVTSLEYTVNSNKC